VLSSFNLPRRPVSSVFSALVVILVIVSIVLIGAILLQSGKGSGLAASFGGASSSSDVIGTHQLATGLTKYTWYIGGFFLLLAYVLFIMSARPKSPKSILDQAPAAQQPVAPVQQQAPAGANPLVPLQPAPTAPAPATTPPR
jgi:preprotein translocase subunit SecG